MVRNLNPENRTSKIFSFDEIYMPEATQDEVFASTGKILVNDVLQGYNGTIFAYGQTGSGKTHTMFGDMRDSEQFGVIPRALS